MHRIEKRKVKDLAAAPYNPRRISERAFTGLRESVRRFGLVQPIIVNERTGNIVGGHQRAKALEAEGVEDADVILVDIAEGEEKALNVALNNGAISGEFTDDVFGLLNEIEQENKELFDALLLGDVEIDVGGVKLDPQEVEEDDVPEPPKNPVTKLGDVWVLGDHRLVCGESQPEMFTQDAILADPPYGVSERTNRRSAGRSNATTSNDYSPVFGDQEQFDPTPWLRHESVLWGGNYFEGIPRSPSWFVWDKKDGTTPDDNADCELAWTNLGGPARVFRHLWRGMIKASEREEVRRHPTQKPVALMVWCLERFKSDEIADPFCGSGPVLLACEQVGKRCFAGEIDPAYCDVIVDRWENLTGKKAKRG